MNDYSKYKRILFSILIINILLVSTHKGEFWPFSIFPMFSQAGNPWSGGLVQEIDTINDATIWKIKAISEIRDRVLPLDSIGVDAIDYSSFVSKTKLWNTQRIKTLRDLLQIEKHPAAKWMVTRIEGHLTERDSVEVEAIPLFLLTTDTTYQNSDMISN